MIGLPAVTGCGIVADDATPDRIVIPSTDELLTESKPSTLSATTSADRSDSNDTPAEWSYERVIKSAPRVSNSEYQVGATTQGGAREDVSGYHFTSPDRTIRCSTGNNGSNALVCAAASIDGPRQAPADEDPGCSWDRDLAVLSGDGASRGGCDNRYNVLFRSRSVPAGSAIVISRFACLSSDSEVTCVESGSGSGFTITDDGYTEIRADEQAPKRLTGVEMETRETSSPSRVVPTR